MYDTEPDVDDLERVAVEALKRPSNAAFWDERMYETHGCTMSWADRGDDLLEESNYLTALAEIQGAAGDDADEHVFDASVSHWLVGSLRQLFVQVRDEAGDFTPAWIEAVKIGLYLKEDYPVLDESDYSEREYAAYEKNLDDAINHVQDDDDSNVDAITEYAYEHEHFADLYGYDGNGGVDWDDVETAWYAAREAFYVERGREIFNAQIDGQLNLGVTA